MLAGEQLLELKLVIKLLDLRRSRWQSLIVLGSGLLAKLFEPPFEFLLLGDQPLGENRINVSVELPQLVNGQLLKLLSVHDPPESSPTQVWRVDAGSQLISGCARRQRSSVLSDHAVLLGRLPAGLLSGESRKNE